MDFGEDSELHALTRKFRESIELGNINASDAKAKKGAPFRTKYDSTANQEKIQTVEQELGKLRDLQSKVLSMQGTMEDTIHKEVQRTREKEIRDIRARYRQKMKELEAAYLKKETELREEYAEKLERVAAKLKEKARDTIVQKVAEEVGKAKKAANKRVLEIRLRDKAVIDKLSQMYIDLKDKYKKDIQGVDK